MEVICDHAKESCTDCVHTKPHNEEVDYCSLAICGFTGELVQCIPVATKKGQDDLLVRLKDQMERTATLNPAIHGEVEISRQVLKNQILIMEALVALLGAR